MKKYDVVAFGEILIDFTQAGFSEGGRRLFEANPGGAPANCAGAVAKLGGKSAFIGMTGRDSFGEEVRAALKEINVDTSGMRYTQSQHTTLAFVSLDKSGERSFSFCRNPGADTQFKSEDFDEAMLSDTRIFHTGSLSLTDEPSKGATLFAVKKAKEDGAVISYDPNYREKLWGGREDAIPLMKSLIPFADIIKVSEEELELLYGNECSSSVERGAEIIMNQGVSLVLVTLGSNGVYYRAKDKEGKVITGQLGVPEVKVADTTCAGDSFTGGLLYRLTRREKTLSFTQKELEEDLNFANSVASICVTRRGAIPALPSLKEVETFIKEHC